MCTVKGDYSSDQTRSNIITADFIPVPMIINMFQLPVFHLGGGGGGGKPWDIPPPPLKCWEKLLISGQNGPKLPSQRS